MHTIGARGLVANKSDAALREVSIVGMSVALAGNDQQITSETLISSRQFLDRASFRHRVRKPGLNRNVETRAVVASHGVILYRVKAP